jgi:hypothetical protein
MLELKDIYDEGGIFLKYNTFSDKYVLDLKGKTYLYDKKNFPTDVESLKASRKGIEHDIQSKKISEDLIGKVLQKGM